MTETFGLIVKQTFAVIVKQTLALIVKQTFALIVKQTFALIGKQTFASIVKQTFTLIEKQAKQTQITPKTYSCGAVDSFVAQGREIGLASFRSRDETTLFCTSDAERLIGM